MGLLQPARLALPVLMGVLALRADDCQKSADGLATLGPALALMSLFTLGVPLAITQATTVWVALTRPRPGGNVAYGLASLWAALAAVGGTLGLVVVADVPARLRHRLTQPLVMVEVEAVLIVGAWFVLTYKRFGASPTPSPDADMIPMAGPPVRVIVVGGAAVCLAALILGFWLFAR